MSKRGTTSRVERLGAGIVLCLSFSACLMEPVPANAHPGHLTIEVKSDAAAGAMPALRMVTVVLTSSARDTLRDTITAQGSRQSTEPAYMEGTLGKVHLYVRYTLKTHRRWLVTVKALDKNDSVIYGGTVSVQDLRDFEYRSVRADLAPRWVGYAARFSFPSVMVAGGMDRAVLFQRVELLLDGAIVRDTTSHPALAGHCLAVADGRKFPGAGARLFFQPGEGAGCGMILAHPYVAPGNHSLDFQAYGYVEGDTVGVTRPRLLLKGKAVLNAGFAKIATEETMALEWAAGASTANAPVVTSGLQLKLGGRIRRDEYHHSGRCHSLGNGRGIRSAAHATGVRAPSGRT
jgi:hypothetical protein